MTKQEKMSAESEELVRRVLTKTFGQKPSDKQIREVAKKIRESLPRPTEEAKAA